VFLKQNRLGYMGFVCLIFKGFLLGVLGVWVNSSARPFLKVIIAQQEVPHMYSVPS